MPRLATLEGPAPGLRIVLQAVAIAILVLAVWWRAKFGG